MFLLAFLDLTMHNIQEHSYHFELTDQLKHCINLFSHNLRTKNRGLCTVRELPTYLATPLFLNLMFAGFPNQSPVLTKVVTLQSDKPLVLCILLAVYLTLQSQTFFSNFLRSPQDVARTHQFH